MSDFIFRLDNRGNNHPRPCVNCGDVVAAQVLHECQPFLAGKRTRAEVIRDERRHQLIEAQKRAKNRLTIRKGIK